MAKSSFRTDVEGLRGVAILLVVLYHAGVPGVGGGYVGVDAFFVLSGYLISGLLMDEVERSGRIDFLQFYARRVRRLLPASALVLLTCVLLGWFVYAPFEQHGLAASAVMTGSYLSNMWFALIRTNYLAADPRGNPLLHTWSLAVEEQFYVVWPALVLLAAWLGRRRGRGVRPAVGVALVLVAVASLAGAFALTSIAQPWAFFSMPARAWEFAVGGLARLVPVALVSTRRGATSALAWAGAAALLGASCLFDDATPFPGSAALIPVLGTAALLVAGSAAGGGGTAIARFLDSRPMQWFGRLSYSWYLWHWPALVFSLDVFGPLSLPQRVATAVLALGLSAATFQLLESPVRHSRLLVPRPVASVALGVCLTLLSVGAAGTWRRAAIRAEADAGQRLFTQASNDLPRVYAEQCHVLPYGAEKSPACVYGDTASATTVALFGDSHAAQWFPALDAVARLRHWRLVSYTKSGCPAAAVRIFPTALGREFVECDRWRESVIRQLVALRPTAVFVGSTRDYVTTNGHGMTSRPVSGAEWAAGTHATVAQLVGAGIRSVLLRDTPRPGFQVPGCLARSAWRGRSGDASCSVSREAALDTLAYGLERGAVDGLPGVSFLDLSDAICGAATCAPERDGVVVYRDGDHLTARFSAALAPRLGDAIGWLAVPAGDAPHGGQVRGRADGEVSGR